MDRVIPICGVFIILLVGILSLLPPRESSKNYKESIKPWPPVIGEVYPDLELIEQEGNNFKLSDYRGKVILLHAVGMNSSVSQAFSGAAAVGTYDNIPLQKELEPIQVLFPRYTKGLNFPNPDVVFINILLYNTRFQHPKPNEVKRWAEHFGFKKAQNMIVAAPVRDLRSQETYGLIPGFQLIDKNFVLQADAAGPKAPDDIVKTLLPMVPIAIAAKKR